VRVLLDECLPRRLASELPGHYVRTVPQQGWNGKKNGELLALAAGQFDVFITIDLNLQYQQNLVGSPLGILVLKAESNRFDALQQLVPDILTALPGLKPGQVVELST
jgi:predicted nuclease of predicted toxin-antitoxin system